MKGAAAGIEGGSSPAEEQERGAGGERVRHSGQSVGDAGARGDDRHAEATRQPCIGVGRVRRALLVPRVDDPDVLIDATGVDRRHVQAGEREDGRDPLCLSICAVETTLRSPGTCGEATTSPVNRIGDALGG